VSNRKPITGRPVRVMLVTPPYHAGVVESAGVWMPLNYVYLAGHARAAGAEVRILDSMSLFMSHEDIAREVEAFAPDILGVGAITAMEPDARLVCGTAKRLNPNTVTVLGNVHPTFCWRTIMTADQNVDVVVRGEGEHAMAELVQAVAAGDGFEKIAGIAWRDHGMPRSTPDRPRAHSLDDFTPAWDLVDWPTYHYRPHPEGRFAIVSSSRGCNQRCSFCSQQKFWERSWRSRDPVKFVDELAMLRRTYDVQVAMLSDETPTISQPRWHRIVDLLIERDLGIEILLETRVDDIVRDEAYLPRYHAAGIRHIYVGVEAADQETLDLYKKDTKIAESKRAIELINQHDIISETSFVLGGPDETATSIKKTVQLAKWYEPDMAFFLAITPWPYADINADLEPFIATRDLRKYNLVEPVVKPHRMTLDEVRRALFFATGDFFHDKFAHLSSLTPTKRDYMVSVLKLLIEHSYLGEEMRKMASHERMPEVVKTMLRSIGISLDRPNRAAAGH